MVVVEYPLVQAARANVVQDFGKWKPSWDDKVDVFVSFVGPGLEGVVDRDCCLGLVSDESVWQLDWYRQFGIMFSQDLDREEWRQVV